MLGKWRLEFNKTSTKKTVPMTKKTNLLEETQLVEPIQSTLDWFDKLQLTLFYSKTFLALGSFVYYLYAKGSSLFV